MILLFYDIFQSQSFCDSVIEAKDYPKGSALAQIYIALMFPSNR